MRYREKAAPDTLADARVQIVHRNIPQRYLCGHLHESRDEALRCAKKLAAWLSSKPVPPDYYLG